MKTTIYRLAKLIAIETFLKDEAYTNEKLSETINEIVANVDIIGEDNLQLRNPRDKEREAALNCLVSSTILCVALAFRADLYDATVHSARDTVIFSVDPRG